MARDKVDSNGSFRVKGNGAVEFTGVSSGDPNQIVTFNPEFDSLESTDLGELFGGACVSQYVPDPPNERPKGDELQIGDLWTDSDTDIMHIYDGDRWVFVKTINGVATGTIITHIITAPLEAPPGGYLRCDGSPCPPQYTELANLLLDQTGSTDLPSLPAGNFIKF